jgi:hypothetical protein
MGVKTPKAADVAAATCGFDIDVHIPNGMILTIGILSIIVAMGMEVVTRLVGNTLSVDGAMPKLHIIIAPPHTQKPISVHLLS